MDKHAREKLTAYIEMGERDDPPEFIGRARELEKFRAFVRSVGRYAKGATMTAHGAPGCGKTALLSQFEKVAASCGDVRVIQLRRTSFESRAQFLMDLASGLGVNNSMRLKAVKGEVNAALLKGRMVFESVDARAFAQSVTDLCAWAPGNPTVIVTLDEAQTLVDLPNRSETKDIFLQLHMGVPGVKIGAVYAGLPNLPLVLEDIASPRLNPDFDIPMPMFKRGETREFVERTSDYLGGEGAARRAALADWAERHCGRWPQHAVNLMRSVTKEMLANGALDLSALDAGRIQARVERDRSAYYAGRWQGFVGQRQAVLAVHAAAGKEGDCLDALHEAAMGVLGNEPREINRLLDKMLRRGHLHPSGPDRYKCPIESLERWGRTRSYSAPELNLDRSPGGSLRCAASQRTAET